MESIWHGGKELPFGLTTVTAIGGREGDLEMDFDLLRLKKGDVYTDNKRLEKAYLLVYGTATLCYHGKSVTVSRKNCFDETPVALHVDKDTDVTVTGLSDDCEFNILRARNDKALPAKLYLQGDVADEHRGAGLMNETSTRIVRTIFDHSTDPDSNLVLGEVIGFPGKWSSYPPHHHPQPEIYYYKTCPEGGFGYAELGEKVLKVRTNDAVFIREGETHPHCTAPGYALWYLWGIRNLPGNPYTTPTFLKEHLWVLEKDAAFWPDREA